MTVLAWVNAALIAVSIVFEFQPSVVPAYEPLATVPTPPLTFAIPSNAIFVPRISNIFALHASAPELPAPMTSRPALCAAFIVSVTPRRK